MLLLLISLLLLLYTIISVHTAASPIAARTHRLPLFPFWRGHIHHLMNFRFLTVSYCVNDWPVSRVYEGIESMFSRERCSWRLLESRAWSSDPCARWAMAEVRVKINLVGWYWRLPNTNVGLEARKSVRAVDVTRVSDSLTRHCRGTRQGQLPEASNGLRRLVSGWGRRWEGRRASRLGLLPLWRMGIYVWCGENWCGRGGTAWRLYTGWTGRDRWKKWDV